MLHGKEHKKNNVAPRPPAGHKPYIVTTALMGPLVDTLGVESHQSWSTVCQIRPQCVHRGSLSYRQPNVARGIDLRDQCSAGL
jgi:hypothetical protein